MLVLGAITTSYMSTGKTHTKRNPRISRFDTVLTHCRIIWSYVFDLVGMGAICGHERSITLKRDRGQVLRKFFGLRKGLDDVGILLRFSG
jgi:hypothetical protein